MTGTGSEPRRAAKLRRIAALVRKETYQALRDPSSIAIGIVVPVMLVLLFGYGLSLDVKNVPVAVVVEDASPDAQALAASFEGSPYFATHLVRSMPEAEQLMQDGAVTGIARIPADFSRALQSGTAELQVIVHGTDANTARIVEGYAGGAIAQWQAHRGDEGYPVPVAPIAVQSRLWFNEANDSHYYLVPGLIVVVMTLIGAFLTALVVVREWDRGTFEALFATPVRADEILIGKTLPYFVMGLAGLALTILGGMALFHVPLRGSVPVLVLASMIYLLVALGIGLAISSATRDQLVASQLALLLSFLPTVLLSGFLFDLRSMPVVVRLLTYLLPARYFVALLQTLFLAGDIWSVILPNMAVLAAMAVGLLLLARAATRKRLA
ncbi:MAG: ABC transporter permease [Deinococcales bacterium]